MGQRSNYFWSEDADERLKHLWETTTRTASDIGAELKLTRNQVLGRVHRRGLKRQHADLSPAEKFERLIDMIVDAPLNRPVTLLSAAQRLGLSPKIATSMWADLCVSLGRQATPGDKFRKLAL